MSEHPPEPIPATEGSRPVLDLSAVREQYQTVGLHRDALFPDPLDQFELTDQPGVSFPRSPARGLRYLPCSAISARSSFSSSRSFETG